MLKANDKNKLMKDAFLCNNEIRKEIILFGSEHEKEVGYTQVWVNSDYTTFTIKFQLTDFEPEEFYYWKNEFMYESDEKDEPYYFYYEVFFPDFTSVKIKELLVLKKGVLILKK